MGRWNAIEFRQSQEEEEKEVYLSNIVHCTNIGRGKFAEIKEIKEISRKSLKNL